MIKLLNRTDRRRKAVYAFLFTLPFAAEGVWAEGDWGGSVGASVSLDDNARKSDTDLIEERQDEVTARLFADYESAWYRFSADYTGKYLNYSEDSQDNRNQLDGRTELFLGRPTGWLSLGAGNERRSVYNAPEDVPISENLDDRSTWYLEPSLIARFNTTNSLTLSARRERVTYKVNELRNSRPISARLTYLRDLSSVSNWQIYAGARDVEYPNGDGDDYENQFVGMGLRSQLRLLSYELRLGYNRATFEDDDDVYEAPNGFFSVDYQAATNQFNFEISQDITDTSSGNAFREDVPDNPQADGVGIDQIERQILRGSWTSQALCSRCETTVGIRLQQDNYRRDNRDGNTQALDLGFNYRFSESMDGRVRYERSKLEYDSVELTGYEADRINAGLEKKLGNQLSVRLFYTFEHRESATDYDQNILGLGISYQLK